VVSESRVTWATSVPILVFLGFSILELGPMYATDRRQTDVRRKHRLMPRLLGAGHNKKKPNERNIFKVVFIIQWNIGKGKVSRPAVDPLCL